MNAPAAEPLVAHLASFVDELRDRGIVVGPSKLIDAAEAVSVLNLLDRTSFREGLACTLLDDIAHRKVFDVVFDLWWPLGGGARSVVDERELPRDEAGEIDIPQLRDRLAQLLADDAAQSDGRMADMVAQIVEQLGSYQSTRGPAFSTYQAMSSVSPQTLIASIAAAMAQAAGEPADGDAPRLGTQARYRRSASDRVQQFSSDIEAETRRRMVAEAGRERVGEYAVPLLPEQMNFLSAMAAEQAELRRTVQPLARLLAAKLEIRRRRNNRGAVDVRRTLRKSMSTGGVPIDLVHRRPRPGRPELVVCCDVSGSVAGFSQFTLQLVYALRQQFSKVRVFAFVDTVDEVTDYFDRSDDYANFAETMSTMLRESAVLTRDGHSDYGHVLRGFVDNYADSLTHRGALLILGDARTNFRDPRADVLATLVDKARHAYWLNPEERNLWDTGDSAAGEYADVIDMYECRNATQLADVIANLLPI
ncbi:vWA domain-containing protein [Jongsikchunia kroppenstedtii]|uniref:vWA domain-containing protein n=1 Tax=Jongsikchunia kroppenstedtii TaxID=1121721 RepID=UPI00037C1505|nr:VWA domain-containing protein [Jongsikchunia kroppenstedtii]